MTWLNSRAYYAIAIVVALFAASGALAAPSWLGDAAGMVFVFWLLVDAVAGPRARDFSVERLDCDPFALRHTGALSYHARNPGVHPLTIGIIEGPSALLRYETEELIAALPARSERILERLLTPVARGSDALSVLYVWYEHPLGVLRRHRRIAAPQTIRVYPDLSAVERFGSLQVRNRLIEAGLRRLRVRGAGTQTESVREWEPGDAFRAINWKATARSTRLMVSQYEVERSQNVMIMLDAGRLMTPRVGAQRKFDYAVTAALSVAAIAALANDKTGVVAFAGEILRATAPRASGRSSSRIAEQIYDIEPVFEESDYERAFAYVRTHVLKRSLILFFTDMVDPVAQSAVLAQIGTLARRHLVVCAFMNDAAIESALEAPARTTAQVYAAGVALELRDERCAAAAVLTRLGVHVIDVPAPDLTTALIDRYLRIKQRGLL